MTRGERCGGDLLGPPPSPVRASWPQPLCRCSEAAVTTARSATLG